MQHRGLVLGPAGTRFNDYVGTVAADDAEVVKDQPSLYELADIDRDRYTILAVDLSIDGAVTATAYAIDRIEHGIKRHSEIAELSAGERQIPIVAFDIPEPNVKDLIRHAFQDLDSACNTASPRPETGCDRAEFNRGHRGLTMSSLTRESKTHSASRSEP